MGQLLYGTLVDAEVEDRSLFHLDVLLARLRGTPFQLHFQPGREHDGSLVSISVTPGVPLRLIYANDRDLRLDSTVVDLAQEQIHDGSFVTIPFTFQSDLGEVGNA
ncbi:MAG: hypothetical protein ACRDT7_11455 [Microbacterium sp.]